MSNPLKDWFIHQALDHPRRAIVLSILATGVLGLGLMSVVIDDDVMKMLPKHVDSRIALDALREEFGNTNMI
ncbi:MAG: hypothetical protein ACE5GH_03640, partial [Fidelibacterota bacterium]